MSWARAEFKCESTSVQRLKHVGSNDWRADEKFLAKRFPERWSDHASKLAVLGPEATSVMLGNNFQINIHLGEPPGGWPKREAIEVPTEKIPIEETKEMPPPGEPRN